MAAKWLGGTIAYLLVGTSLCLAVVLALMKWAYGNDDSAALGLVMFMLLAPLLALCVFWGIIYAPALAKAGGLGDSTRAWSHLALSNVLGVLGFAIFWRGIQSPLPFGDGFVTSAFIFCVCSVSLVCLVLGMLVRVHLEQGRKWLPQNGA